MKLKISSSYGIKNSQGLIFILLHNSISFFNHFVSFREIYSDNSSDSDVSLNLSVSEAEEEKCNKEKLSINPQPPKYYVPEGEFKKLKQRVENLEKMFFQQKDNTVLNKSKEEEQLYDLLRKDMNDKEYKKIYLKVCNKI